MYTIKSLASSGRIVTQASESKVGTAPGRQHYIRQEEHSYATVVSCKWTLRLFESLAGCIYVL